MAFLLRTVSHSAEGREIVRSSRVEGERLTIGRSPDNSIRLSDLAAALHHAVVERVGPHRLEIRTGEGLYVDLNGRKVHEGTIDLATGGEIAIASHVLKIAPVPEGSDEIAIDVSRIGEDEEESAARTDVRRFGFSSVMPGKRPLAWTLAVIVLGVFLAWPVWTFYGRTEIEAAKAEGFHADRLWLSGGLSAAHASLESNCTACHAEAFESVRDEACLTCHTGTHDHADPVRLALARPGLDGWGKVQLAFKSAFNLPPGRCIECHTEHEGPQEMPVTAQRFCADCHAGLTERLPDSRIGDAGDFGQSHPEFQPLTLIRWNGDDPFMRRIRLDRNPRENSNLKFPHDLHLASSGGVAQMARRLSGQYGFGTELDCADCHVPSPDGVRFQPVSMEEDCSMCHSLAFDRVGGTIRTLRHGAPDQVVADLREFYRANRPETPAELGAGVRRRPGDMNQARGSTQFARARSGASAAADRAVRAVFSTGGACFDCHVVDQPPSGSMNFGIRPVAFPTRYLLHGWFDHRPHQQTDCSECHKADASRSASDLLIPGLESCRTCHGGEASNADVPSSCAMCHDYHMDEGAPAMLLRKRARGMRWENTTIPVAGAGSSGGR